MADVALQKRLRPLKRSPPAVNDPEAGRGGGVGGAGGSGSSSSSSQVAAAAASPVSSSKTRKGKAASTPNNTKASFFSVLALCDPVDALLLFVGCVGAAANGAALPLFSLAFGSMVDVLGPTATAGALRSEVERVAGYFLILAAGNKILEERDEGRERDEGEQEREGLGRAREGDVFSLFFSLSFDRKSKSLISLFQ